MAKKGGKRTTPPQVAPLPPPRTSAPPPLVQPKHDAVAIAFFVALLLVCFSAVLQLLSSYITVALLAILVANLFGPLHRWLVARIHRSWLASLMICFVIAAIALGPIIFLLVTLSAEAADLYETAKTQLTLAKVESYLFGTGWFATNATRLASMIGLEYTPESVKAAVAAALSTLAGFLAEQANAILSNLVSFFFKFVILLLITFYLLGDGTRFKEWIFRMSPLPDDEDELLFSKFTAVGRAILFGNGASSVAQGTLGGIAMGVAGIPSPVLWGTVIALAAFLPLIGISAVTIPAALYLVIEGRYAAAVTFFLFCAAMGLFFENVVKTKVIGSQMRMNDLLIFLSVLGGIGAFGIVGLLYGPLLVALFIVLCDLYEERYKPQLTR